MNADPRPSARGSAPRTRIVVFAKAPIAGFAKTRLMPRLGAQGAAQLAARLLDHAVAEAVAAGVGPVELWTAPHLDHPAFLALQRDSGIALLPQGDGDLGERMARAFAWHLGPSRGADDKRLLLIGTDAPGVDRHYLRRAAAALDQHDAVFGPALDGGYTLVGLRRPAPQLFDAMPWSTPQVMAETRRRLSRLGLRHAELPALGDIDEPADLDRLPAGWLEALPDRPTPPEI